MAGYTRQSVADIIASAVIKAAPINAELNTIRDAFAQATGHTHDGTSAEGAYVPLISDVNAYNKVVVDDTDNRIRFFADVASVAVEQLRVEDGVVYPVTTNDIDLGTGSLQFKDAYFDGTVRADTLLIDESATITANLTVSGNTIIGNAATDTVTVTADVASNLIPSADSTYTLGDALNYWSNAYLDAVTTTGNVDIGANLTVNGTADFTNTTLVNVSDPTAAQHAATKNYVDTAISDLIGGAPLTLDTLNEIAAAINDDAAVYTTLVNQLALKLNLTGGTLSGALAMGGNLITGLATPVTGTDATTKTYVDGILGSATAAAASAASASADAASTAAAYDSFDDRYLGDKATAPTVDNDGDALTAGVLYFDTTAEFMYVYTGSSWALAGSSVNGTSSRQTYTATAAQTTFAIVYDVGFVDVYLNGVKQLSGTDFTATNGTSVVLTVGATVGDIVDMVAYGAFEVANALTVANSLSDVASAATARTNLGLAIGTNVMAYDATMLVDADIGVSVQAYDATYVVDADIGVSVQAYDSNLQSFVTAVTLPVADGTAGQFLKTDGAGTVTFATVEAFDTQTLTTTAVTQVAVATYAIATYDAIKAVISMYDSVGVERSVTEMVITHDGVTAVATEYAQLSTLTALSTFDVDISAGNVRILATPASTNSTAFTVKAITL